MSTSAIREYVALLWGEYQGAKRRRRSGILDELCRNLSIHRKSAVRLMRARTAPRFWQGKGSHGRPVYSDQAKAALKVVWKEMGYLGSVRLKAALPDWLPYFTSPICDEGTRGELLRMGASTIERILKADKAALQRRLNTGTKRSKSSVQTAVPVRNFQVQPTEPGHCEIDCVAHCGGSLSGTFIWTVTLTDISTGHTECEAIWGKNGVAVRLALTMIEGRLPFALRSLYFDNGCEFLNDQVVDLYAKSRPKPLEVFRGRPYRSNDQPHVEQKNYSHVRTTFGYDRLDSKLMLQLMNNVYRKEWRDLHNLFYPQTKLVSKTRQGSRIKRVISKPATPYARLMDSDCLTDEAKNQLALRRAELNPFKLRNTVRKKLRNFRLYKPNKPEVMEKYAL